MYLTADDNMRRSWRGCTLMVMLLLATNYMVQGQDETIPCNVTTNEGNSSSATQNSSCCFNSTSFPDCPDGFYKLNKTSKIPCSYESNVESEETIDYDIIVCMQQCPLGWISSEDNWCVENHCDDDNCLTCSGSSPSTCTSCRENSELKDGKCALKFPLALVIGCSVGGVVAVVVIIVIIVFCVKRRKRKETSIESDHVLNVENRREEVEGTIQNISTEEDDTYVNGPQKFQHLTSGIEQGHDKIFRYVRDPTSKKILTNTEKLAAQMNEKSAEDLELQSLPTAPVPRGNATKKVLTNKSQHSKQRETEETRGRDRPDSGELYVNVGNVSAVLEDDSSLQSVNDDYVNAETFSKKTKIRNTTTNASSTGNDSDDDEKDYENEEVINTLKHQNDDVYVNLNLHQTCN